MFTAGQKVRVKEFKPFQSGRWKLDDGNLREDGFKPGDIVTIDRGGKEGSDDLVRLREGGGLYFAWRFEAIAAEPAKASGLAAVVPPIPEPFAKGDKVKVVEYDGYLAKHGFPVGSTGIVARYGTSSGCGSQKFIWLVGPSGIEVGGTSARHFELVKPERKPKHETVYVSEGAQRVASAPEDFSDGQEVAVYQFVRFAKVQKVTTTTLA